MHAAQTSYMKRSAWADLAALWCQPCALFRMEASTGPCSQRKALSACSMTKYTDHVRLDQTHLLPGCLGSVPSGVAGAISRQAGQTSAGFGSFLHRAPAGLCHSSARLAAPRHCGPAAQDFPCGAAVPLHVAEKGALPLPVPF